MSFPKGRLALAVSLLALAARPALGQAEEQAKKLLDEKGLATAKLPADQWLATYAGSVWTEALRLTASEENKEERRFDLERIESREEKLPKRDRTSWWVDGKGTLIRGERKVYAEAGEEEPRETLKYSFAGGKVKISSDPGGSNEEVELAGAFVPDPLLAVLLVPSEKGKVWKFTTFNQDKVRVFTLEDKGSEKVSARSGEVEARKLVFKDEDGEIGYWLDDARKVLVTRAAKLKNMVALAGTEAESRADWSERGEDAADTAAQRVYAAAASPKSLAGELAYNWSRKEDGATVLVKIALKEEEKDGKPAFHFTSTSSLQGGEAKAQEVSEWWLSPDGSPLAASHARTEGVKTETTTGKIAGGKITIHSSTAEADDKDTVLALPARFVADEFLLLKALAKEEKGTFRFGGLDLSGENPLSCYFSFVADETIKTKQGEVKARRFHLEQNSAEAECWTGIDGTPLLMRWSDGDVYAAPNVDPKLDPTKAKGE